jgi:hypothetical protein
MMVGSVRARGQVTAASSGIAAATSTADNALWPGENRAEVPHLAWIGFVLLNLLALYYLILSVVIGIIEGSPAQWGMNYLAPEQRRRVVELDYKARRRHGSTLLPRCLLLGRPPKGRRGPRSRDHQHCMAAGPAGRVRRLGKTIVGVLRAGMPRRNTRG